jgi:hypothetical protein
MLFTFSAEISMRSAATFGARSFCPETPDARPAKGHWLRSAWAVYPSALDRNVTPIHPMEVA